MSANKSFEASPSPKSLGDETEKCKGCNKFFQSNAIMKHIARVKECKQVYGSEYELMRLEKTREKKRNYRTKNQAKIKQQKVKYNNSHRQEKCEKEDERRKKSKANWTAEDRYRAFMNDIKDGPTHVCMSCHRSLFISGVKILEGKRKENFESKVTLEFLSKEILLSNGEEEETSYYKFCHSCLSCITKKKVPKIHISNGLWLDTVPGCLKLTELEQQMIAKNLIFMKIKKLPRSGMNAMVDRVINVPLEDDDVQNTVNSLPRPPNKAGVIGVRLKRKMEMKNAHLEQYVRPDMLEEALEYLKSTGNPFYQNIVINRNFMEGNISESDGEEDTTDESDEEDVLTDDSDEEPFDPDPYDPCDPDPEETAWRMSRCTKALDESSPKKISEESKVFWSLVENEEDLPENPNGSDESDKYEKVIYHVDKEFFEMFDDLCATLQELGVQGFDGEGSEESKSENTVTMCVQRRTNT